MTGASPLGRSSDDDLFVLCMAGLVGIGAAGAALTAGWAAAVRWMLEHGVIVAAAARPAMTVPHSGGAGPDVPRLALLAASALLLSVIVVCALRRHGRGERG